MALDNKISNIIGSKLPQWLLKQLETRSLKAAKDSRTNDDILFITNKSAWIRLVSSVNVTSEDDLNYFRIVTSETTDLNAGSSITDQTSLAKNYVLFGGTSKYLNNNSYGLRSGFGKDGSYGMLGINEIRDFGYKPMPGINSVSIETQGKLGSVRAATINFKCWDKNQLDIIDALYFKLGFTMFLEWGHTYFYPSPGNSSKLDPDRVVSTELYSIDPFESGLTKEEINIKIARNSRITEGNYDGMLGMVTNFNFTYNQDGGYDCTIKLLGLGALGDSIKINNSGTLPALLEEEIVKLNKTLADIEYARQVREAAQNNPNPTTPTATPEFPDCITTLPGATVINVSEAKLAGTNLPAKAIDSRAVNANVNNVNYYFYKNGKWQTSGLSVSGSWSCNSNVLYINGKEAFADQFTYQSVLNKAKNPKAIESSLQERYYLIQGQGEYNYFAIDKFKNLIPIDSDKEISANLNLAAIEKLPSFSSTGNSFVDLLLNALDKTKNDSEGFIAIGKKLFQPLNRFDLDQNGKPKPVSTDLGTGVGIRYTAIENLEAETFGDEDYDVKVEYSGINKKPYLVQLQYNKSAEARAEAQGSGWRASFEFPSKKQEVQDAIKSAAVNPQTKWRLISVEKNGTFIAETEIEVILNDPKLKQTGTDQSGNAIRQTVYEKRSYFLTLKLTFNDLSILSSFSISDIKDLISPKDAINPVAVQQTATNQNQVESTSAVVEQAPQKPDIKAIATQVKQSLNYQSSLEVTLRTIQVHALNKAINQTSKPDLEIGKTTYVLPLYDSKDIVNFKDVNSKNVKAPFLTQIFSTGVFSNFIIDLVNNRVNQSTYTTVEKMDPLERFKIQAAYGFATSLMANKADIDELEKVNFLELLKAYVVPYQINQEIIKGTVANHPVYIPLGLLLMILNHSCTIYDTKQGSNFQTPLVYIDFNPELNFCLTNQKQLSTDPWTCLVPFEGSFEDFKALFDKSLLSDDGKSIQGTSDSKQTVPLFNPEKQDFLSGTLPKLKFDNQPIINESTKENGNVYRGKMMNILLSVDYLVQLAQQYSLKDGTNSVYLKTYIEQILSDINKSLGNFNAFRLSYNDAGNTFQIIDDQVLPTLGNEQQVTPIDNTTELPLLGKFSIAKNIEIKTEMSSKLANMMAISANSTVDNKATLSTNGDSVGFINTNFVDRYVKDRLEITGSLKSSNDALKISAQQFNSAIADFYSKINPSPTTVSHATNYYMEKMSNVKNADYATRASYMIPLSLNFTTDGISGMGMGQAFTAPDKLLPYTYTTRKTTGFSDERINNVGFVVVGLNHTIENNQWNTSVRANMIFLKNKTEFDGSVLLIEGRKGTFGVNASRISQDTSYSAAATSGTCEDPYVDTNLNRGWTGKKQPFQRTIIDPSVEGPKLKAKYGEVLAKAVLATIKIEQGFKGFNYNLGGFDITSGGWQFNPELHNGYVVAREGGTNLCKAFVSFISFEAFVEQTISSFKRKGFESASDANAYAKIWYEKWNGFGVRTKYPNRPTAEVDAEALRDAASIWNSINV